VYSVWKLSAFLQIFCSQHPSEVCEKSWKDTAIRWQRKLVAKLRCFYTMCTHFHQNIWHKHTHFAIVLQGKNCQKPVSIWWINAFSREIIQLLKVCIPAISNIHSAYSKSKETFYKLWWMMQIVMKQCEFFLKTQGLSKQCWSLLYSFIQQSRLKEVHG